MRIIDIIAAKRDGRQVSGAEIKRLVAACMSGEADDAQIAAWLMSVYIHGLSRTETLALTEAMRDSGLYLDLSDIDGPKIDKHSSGGVGDKITLVVAPLLAAAGVKVPKMSGKSLGHTGGTLDKLASIPGWQSELSTARFKEILQEVGAAIISQSVELAPADKKLYALRDHTATVASLPLIAASIMSKKLALGTDAVVLDVKVGSGAFMKDIKRAKELAALMVWLGRVCGRPTKVVLSDMNQPLGRAVGNALEVAEALAVLKGGGPPDVRRLSLIIGAEMLRAAGLEADGERAQTRLAELLDNGAAEKKFKEMVAAQGGKPGLLDNWPTPAPVGEFKAEKSGYINITDAALIGAAARDLAAAVPGRLNAVDYQAGIVMAAKSGDFIKKDETVAVLYAAADKDLTTPNAYLQRAVKIVKEPPKATPLVFEVVG